MNTKEGVTEKYFMALKDIHSALQYTDKISIASVAAKHAVGKSLSTVLVSGGILKSNGSKGKGTRYTWNSTAPNIKMADELRKRLNEYTNISQIKYQPKRKVLEATKSGKTIIAEISKTRTVIETVFLWGLYRSTETILN